MGERKVSCESIVMERNGKLLSTNIQLIILLRIIGNYLFMVKLSWIAVGNIIFIKIKLNFEFSNIKQFELPSIIETRKIL